MLNKLSNFIVNKRIAILGIMLVFAIVAAICSGFVAINEDMAKYLPSDSNMKAGVDLMAEAFPEMETSNTIRVMFDDLKEGDGAIILEKLKAIAHVDDVDHDPESPDYNKDNHTLFVINMSCDYGSAEEEAIEAALSTQFADYQMVWQSDDPSTPEIPVIVIAVALIMATTILIVMCGSWIEPFLFLATIGIAVVINAGTNIFLGEIASVTKSIAALLQMVLSMDYSIILMNRYRQERQLESDKVAAMKQAWANSFASIASSSLTTVVGLLMLVFMSFKIGTNIGVVLAKGVFISMVCVLTILPGLALICDNLLIKTAKKEAHIPMNWAAKFSHKCRFVLTGLFLVLFVGFYIWQTHTGIAYTLVKDDAVAHVFPKSNTVVMVYESKDEENLSDLISRLEENDKVSSVTGYGTTLGKPYAADKLLDAIKELSDDVDLDPVMINMLYYHYYNDGKVGTMTPSAFLNFISDTVMKDEAFADYIDDDMRNNVDLIHKFADAEALQKPMTADDLAEVFDMDAGDIRDLFLLYQIENNTAATGRMTLATFADFVVNDVSKDSAYSAMFDKATVSKLSQLSTYTNAKKMTTPYTYKGIATLLGMDEDTAKRLFMYYYALSDSYDPGTMTLPVFVSFLQNDIATDPVFSAYLDQDTLAQVNALSAYTDKTALQTQLDPATLASMLGIEETMAQTIFILHNAQDVSDKTMTLPQFTGFLTGYLLNDPMFAGSFDEQTAAQLQTTDSLVQLAASNAPLSAAELAAITGMEEQQITLMFTMQGVSSMPLTAFLEVATTFDPENAQLLQLSQLCQLAASGTPLDIATLATTFTMEESLVTTIFRLYFGSDISTKTMSLEEAVDFILVEPLMAGYMDAESITQLQTMQQMIKATVNDTPFTCAALAQMLGMDSSSLKMLFTVYAAQTQLPDWTVSMQTMVNFLVKNKSALGSMMDSSQLSSLTTAQAIINGAVKKTSYTAAQIADLTGMTKNQARQLYLLYTRKHGNTSGWKLSIKGFIDFVNSKVLTNKNYADKIDAEMSEMLSSAKGMVNAVIANKALTPAEMADIFRGLTDELDTSAVELMYLYAESLEKADPTWTMTLEGLFNYLVDHILTDPRFDSFIQEDMRSSLLENKATLEDGKQQLTGQKYARLIINTTYLEESAETTAFVSGIRDYAASNMEGETYLIGNSPMNCEMQQIFDTELTFITLLTAFAIFMIVALTFRSLSIPLILVLLVQCGVYITVTVTGIMSGSMYFLALLIVECILMGATIDYGILFTNYYCEHRRTSDAREALKQAYAGSIHTIMSSGLILVTVTAIVGRFFEDATVAAIVRTISIGAFCAIILILFVLPGVLAACDKLITKKKNRAETTR